MFVMISITAVHMPAEQLLFNEKLFQDVLLAWMPP